MFFLMFILIWMDVKMLVFLGFLLASIAVLFLAASASTQILPYPLKILLLIVAMVFDVIAFSSRYYTYLIIPMLQQRRRVINLGVGESYRFTGNEDALIRKVGDLYTATVYIIIPLYRSATEMNAEEKLDFGKQVGRLVSISRDPVRFSTQMNVMNKDSYIQLIKDMINSTETEVIGLTQKNAPQSELERAKGKVSMWRNVLDSTTKVSSLELITYSSVSASGSKEAEAVSFAQQRARDIVSAISTTFGVTPMQASGESLKRLIEPEYILPVTTVTEEITKHIEEEVV